MGQTFREKTVEELLLKQPSTKSALAFLSAVAKQNGEITILRKRENVVISMDSYQEAAYVVETLKSIYPTEFEISADEIKSGSKKGQRAMSVSIPMGFTRQALADMKIVGDDFVGFECGVPESFVVDAEMRKEYLRGLYLACGGIYVPTMTDDGEKRDGYHLEFRFDDEDRATDIQEFLSLFGVSAKISERGVMTLVYLKDKDEILKLLSAMDLYDSVMELKRIIDERETANSLNRAVICETANLDKTFAAASKQLLAIGLIEEEMGLEKLSPTLRETASVRLEYRQASLQELADILGVTKNCLNHRLRKIVEIADGLNGD